MFYENRKENTNFVTLSHFEKNRCDTLKPLGLLGLWGFVTCHTSFRTYIYIVVVTHIFLSCGLCIDCVFCIPISCDVDLLCALARAKYMYVRRDNRDKCDNFRVFRIILLLLSIDIDIYITVSPCISTLFGLFASIFITGNIVRLVFRFLSQLCHACHSLGLFVTL